MAALNKKNLVKDGKYNRAEVMKRAWAYVRNPFNTMYRGNFKAALKAAWIDARLVMEEYKQDLASEGKPLFPNKGLSIESLYCSYNMRMGHVCR